MPTPAELAKLASMGNSTAKSMLSTISTNTAAKVSTTAAAVTAVKTASAAAIAAVEKSTASAVSTAKSVSATQTTPAATKTLIQAKAVTTAAEDTIKAVQGETFTAMALAAVQLAKATSTPAQVLPADKQTEAKINYASMQCVADAGTYKSTAEKSPVSSQKLTAENAVVAAMEAAKKIATVKKTQATATTALIIRTPTPQVSVYQTPANLVTEKVTAFARLDPAEMMKKGIGIKLIETRTGIFGTEYVYEFTHLPLPEAPTTYAFEKLLKGDVDGFWKGLTSKEATDEYSAEMKIMSALPVASLNIVTSPTAKMATAVAASSSDDVLKNAGKFAEVLGPASGDDAAKAALQTKAQLSLENAATKTAAQATPEVQAAIKAGKVMPPIIEIDEFAKYAAAHPQQAVQSINSNPKIFASLAYADKMTILEAMSRGPGGAGAVSQLANTASNAFLGMLSGPAKAAAVGLGIIGGVMAITAFVSKPADATALKAIFEDGARIAAARSAIKEGNYEVAMRQITSSRQMLETAKTLYLSNPITQFQYPTAGMEIDAKLADLAELEKLIPPEDVQKAQKAAAEAKAKLPVLPAIPPPSEKLGTLQIRAVDGATNAEASANVLLKLVSLGVQTKITGEQKPPGDYYLLKKDSAGLVSSNYTPMIISSVPAGLYDIILNAYGYDELQDTLIITPGEYLTKTYTLTKKLEVEAKKEEAKVYVAVYTEPSSEAYLWMNGEPTYAKSGQVFSLSAGTYIFQAIPPKGFAAAPVQIVLTGTEGTMDVRIPMEVVEVEQAKPLPQTTAWARAEKEAPAEKVPYVPPEKAPPEYVPPAAPEQKGWEYTITSDPPGASIYVNGSNTFKKTPAQIILAGDSDYIIMVDMFGFKPAFATLHTDPF